MSGFLPLCEWAPFLSSHSEQHYVVFLVRGMQYGFRVDFDITSPLGSAPASMQSALSQGEVVDHMIAAKEAARGLSAAPLPTGVHTNPIGVIPMRHQPNKFLLIVDLSTAKVPVSMTT